MHSLNYSFHQNGYAWEYRSVAQIAPTAKQNNTCIKGGNTPAKHNMPCRSKNRTKDLSEDRFPLVASINAANGRIELDNAQQRGYRSGSLVGKKPMCMVLVAQLNR